MLHLPLSRPVEASLRFPQQTVRAGLAELDLTLPFQALSIGSLKGPGPTGAPVP